MLIFQGSDDLETVVGGRRVKEKIGSERVFIAPSCSLLHTPCDLDNETQLHSEIKNWLAFAKQKVNEVIALKELSEDNPKEKFLKRMIYSCIN